MAPNPEQVRTRLRAISILLFLLAISSLALLGWREVRVRQDVFASILEDRARSSAREFGGFFGPVQQQLAVIRSWGESGDLALANPASLDARFIPILDNLGWAVSLSIVGSDGIVYQLTPSASGWKGILDPDLSASLNQSAWYRAAVSGPAGQTHWTSTPAGEAGRELVLTASVFWADPVPPHASRVVGMEVSTATREDAFDGLRVTENGMLALLPGNGKVFWYRPAVGRRFELVESAALLEPAGAEADLLSDALYAWSRGGAVEAAPLRFDHRGSAWWAWRGPLAVGGEGEHMLLLLPESDLSARLMTVTSPLTYGLLALFGLSVILLVRFTYRLRGRLERVTSGATHVNSPAPELRALIDAGESDHLEFKSTLRWNIKEARPGKEIELAWLKTVVAFLNSEGGTLLVGVTDAGKVSGCSLDGFPNHDRYLLHVNNLIQRHVGVEFARYLHYDLREVEGEYILVMDVRPADEPAYLRTNDDDLFYVRMGPASRKLSLRKTLEFLKENKGR